MIDQATPTRAEVSDIANAILDGTDALMLSAETSVGKFPVQAVHTMAHVAEVAEQFVESSEKSSSSTPRVLANPPAAALARGAWQIAQDLEIKLVVIWSQNGSTARVFAKHHFPVPIVALSSSLKALRRMALLYGVLPQEANRPDNMGALIELINNLALKRKLAVAHDRILIVAGWSPAMPDTMNGIILHVVGEKWSPLSPAVRPTRTPPAVEKR